MKILVCGGAGYIGSHVCLALAEQAQEVIVLDNLSNSSPVALTRVESLTGCSIKFIQGDVRNPADLRKVFALGIDAVIHFAALKSVGDSCLYPLDYFDCNVAGSIALLRAMESFGVKNLVFSSSATVYGAPDIVPVAEDAPLKVANPYGRTKLIVEEIIADYCAARSDFSATILRYFNPIGAHSSGQIGEDQKGAPNNLMPFLTQVAVGRRPVLHVFGDDYLTLDGTGVRDYIHVMDLAGAHVCAMEKQAQKSGCNVFNVGTGRGYSVLEVIRTFESVTGVRIPFQVQARRAGDVAEYYADASRIKAQLQWEARLGLEQMCADAWRWQKFNPLGYSSA